MLVDRGTCQFSAKQAVAAERGAVALVVANSEDGDEMGGTLGVKTNAKIPVVSITKESGERLRGAPGEATISSRPGSASSTPAMSSPRRSRGPPPTW